MTTIRNFAAVAGLLAFLGLAAPALAGGADGMIVRASEHDVSTTVERLIAAIEKRGVGVFSRVDHAAGASKAGLELDPIVVVLFGNPKLGAPLMKAAPTIGVDLPMKALVWEGPNGTTLLGYNDPAWLKARHGVEGADAVFDKMAGALDAIATEATAAE